MTTQLTSSSREQQLENSGHSYNLRTSDNNRNIVHAVAGPSAQVPLFHSLVSMLICE